MILGSEIGRLSVPFLRDVSRTRSAAVRESWRVGVGLGCGGELCNHANERKI